MMEKSWHFPIAPEISKCYNKYSEIMPVTKCNCA